MTAHLHSLHSSVRRFVADLAVRHNINPGVASIDGHPLTFSRRQADRVPKDITRDTLLALRRAGVLDAETHAHLLLEHLRECRAAEYPT